MREAEKHEWYLRGLVLSSFLLQVLLCYLPPLRRTTRSDLVQLLTSMVFSLSTWVPSFTLLLICSRAIYGDDDSDSDTSNYSPPLLLWASLMVLHLAGHGQERETPYPIQTSDRAKEFYGILLTFVLYHVPLLFGVFLFQSGREETNLALVLLLLLACMRTFSKLKHLRAQSKEVDRLSKSKVQLCYDPTINYSGEREVSKVAHALLRLSQKIFWLNGVSDEEQQDCSNFFVQLKPSDVVTIVQAELNLIYDKFYGGVQPSIFEVLLAVPLLDFESDSTTPITYMISSALIFCTVMLATLPSLRVYMIPPTISFLLLLYLHMYQCITSRHLQTRNGVSKLVVLVDRYVISLTAVILTQLLVIYVPLMKHATHFMGQDNIRSQRWNKTIPQFNLLVNCLTKKPTKVPTFIHGLLNSYPVSTRSKQYTDDLGEFIWIKFLRITKSSSLHYNEQWVLLLNRKQVPFEEIVLCWHLATGILYHTCNSGTSTTREWCMVLSNYMGYLLMVQPWIMSNQRGDSLRRSRDALSEITKLIKSICIQGDDQLMTEEMWLADICLEMIRLYSSGKWEGPGPSPQSAHEKYRRSPSMEKDETYRSSLAHDASGLAVNIKSEIPDTDKMWEHISQVWAEMLAYAVINSDPMDHIRSLSQGGELATILWLFMLHLGNV